MPKRVDYFKTQGYQQLLTKIKPLLNENFSQGLVDINQMRLKNYWQIGKSLGQLQKQVPDATLSQKSPTLQQLAKDLKSTPSKLYRMRLFYRHWSKTPPFQDQDKVLSWTHYLELLNVDQAKARLYYHQQAVTYHWSRDTLRQAIKLKLFEQVERSGRHGKIPEIPSPFYTYTATPVRILDGDTLEAKIDLGFHLSFETMLRLRGINTPELDNDPTGRAAKAKERLQEILSQQDFFVIKSYKTDVYGRFLADIFYHPTFKDKAQILKQGIFLNQQLLDEGLGEWLVM